MHQRGITGLIIKCMKNVKNKQSQKIIIKTVGVNNPGKIKWSILPLADLESSIVGAIIVASPVNT